MECLFHGPERVGDLARLDQENAFRGQAPLFQRQRIGLAKILAASARAPNPDDGSGAVMTTQGLGEKPGLNRQGRRCVEIVLRTDFVQAGLQVEQVTHLPRGLPTHGWKGRHGRQGSGRNVPDFSAQLVQLRPPFLA